VYFIEIRKRIIKTTGYIYNSISPIVIDPLFSCIFRTDGFYANDECTKYSITRIDKGYKLFSEVMKIRFPGYVLDRKKMIIKNESDIEVDLA